MVSTHFISKDAPPANRFVTASCTFPLSLEETKLNHHIELFDLGSDELIANYKLPLPEIVQSNRCTDISLLLPSSSLLVGFTCSPWLLPSSLPNSTVALHLDFILPHEGKYEIRQRAEGVDGSEHRQVFTVVAVDS